MRADRRRDRRAESAGSAIGAFGFEGFFREASGRGGCCVETPVTSRALPPGADRRRVPAGPDARAGDRRRARRLRPGARRRDGALGRWRDREFAEHYWLAYDLEEAGAVPAVLVEILRRLQQQGKGGGSSTCSTTACARRACSPRRACSARAPSAGQERHASKSAAGRAWLARRSRGASPWLNRRPAYVPEGSRTRARTGTMRPGSTRDPVADCRP